MDLIDALIRAEERYGETAIIMFTPSTQYTVGEVLTHLTYDGYKHTDAEYMIDDSRPDMWVIHQVDEDGNTIVSHKIYPRASFFMGGK